MPLRSAELKLSAQTAYAELFEQARAFEMSDALAGLTGSFQKLNRKGKDYWYFAYRDSGRSTKMVYVGPDEPRVKALVEKFAQVHQDKPLAPAARSAIALGCNPIAPKHFRIIKRLAEYGFFRGGGILIGTHAFLALGNILGVRWQAGAATLDVDFAHAGKNISVALPASIKIDAHGALESLEMGFLPITQFDGLPGTQYRNPADQELRVDFVTSMTRDKKPVRLQELNVALEPLKFMEFSLEQTTQGCVFSNSGACVVNLPAPERFAVHKLIVFGERPVSERPKSRKDLLQAASLISYFLESGQGDVFNAAWIDALRRGKGWASRAIHGRDALLAIAPDLSKDGLWANQKQQ